MTTLLFKIKEDSLVDLSFVCPFCNYFQEYHCGIKASEAQNLISVQETRRS